MHKLDIEEKSKEDPNKIFQFSPCNEVLALRSLDTLGVNFISIEDG